MNERYINNISNTNNTNDTLIEQSQCCTIEKYKETFHILTEEDFYPPSDDRVLESYVEDIDGGDNFADYCEYIFDLLEEEDYYE